MPPPDAKRRSTSDEQIKDFVLSRWNTNRKFIDRLASEFGFKTLFVWQPVPTYDYDLKYAVPIGWRWRHDAGTAAIIYPAVEQMTVSGEMGSNFLYLGNIQKNDKRNLYVDAWHYTPAFNREIASLVYRAMRTDGLL
jgi:hypothetical protein